MEAIKYAWLLVEIAPEKSVSAFLEWFGRVVRARPLKLEQLRVWESTSWRLALGLRARVSFADMTSEIMQDTQPVQDALNREIAVAPAKTKKILPKIDPAVTCVTYKGGKDGKKGKGYGERRFGKGDGEDRRWTPYNQYRNQGSSYPDKYEATQNQWSQGSRARLGGMRRSSSRRTRDSAGHLPRPVRRVDPTTFA